MKLIQPAEISAKIMTLIDNAEKELIIISPYNKIVGWTKLTNRIKKAQSKNIKISWYSRKNHVYPNNAEEVRSLGIEPILINDIHAKLYMNETTAIFTSMNMSKVSDDCSLDIGYLTENKKEYEEIYEVYSKYIRNTSNKISPSIKSDNSITKSPSLPKLKSNHFYINQIHAHILFKYGIKSFSEYALKKSQDKLEILSYVDFNELGYKLEFEPFDRAIKIKVYLPLSVVPDNYNRNIELNRHSGLSNRHELSYSDYEHNIKYYFETRYYKLENWNTRILKDFLADLDIVLGITYTH